MRQEVLVSAAIIGTSVVAAVVIAGGPSGIWPTDANDGPVAIIGTSVSIAPAPTTSEPTDEVETSVPTASAATSTVVVTTTAGTTASSVASSPPVVTLPPTTSSPETSTPAPTTTPDGLRDRADLVVAVANASGIGGLAALRSAELAALGYTDPAAVNAEPFPFTLVYAAADLTAEGARLAEDAGLPASAVLPIEDAPKLDTFDVFDAILVLGADQQPVGT